MISGLPLTGLYYENVDMNLLYSTGIGQMSSFSIVCLNTNSDTLRRVVQADLNLQPCSSACWTAQLLSAFQVKGKGKGYTAISASEGS